MHRLWELLHHLELSWTMALVGAALGVMLTVFAYWAVMFLVIRIPADYFCEERLLVLTRQHPLQRWALRIGKNLAGLLVVLVGVILALPGVPGPGLVFIAMGLFLLDFPGKRKLELRLIAYPMVLRAINGRRIRAGAEPLIIPPVGDSPHK